MNQSYYGAIDIGGSKILIGVLSASGEIVAQERTPLARGATREQIMGTADRLQDLAGDTSLLAVGVTIPGLADIERGEWVHSPFTKIEAFPIRDELSRKLGVPVAIDNDVNLCALAEHRVGVCVGASDFLWITVSNGVGGALFLNGSLYRGAFGNAGEIGHVVVEPGGRGGDTQIIGSLEAYACGRAISETYAQRSGSPAHIDARQVAELARNGNTAAISAFSHAGRVIGRACAAAINILNLPLVVIGGGVAKSFDLLEPAIREQLREEVFGAANPCPRVVVSAFPTEAALIGAGQAAKDLAVHKEKAE